MNAARIGFWLMAVSIGFFLGAIYLDIYDIVAVLVYVVFIVLASSSAYYYWNADQY